MKLNTTPPPGNIKYAVAFLILFLCRSLFISLVAFGQTSNEVEGSLSDVPQNVAPVKVDGRRLFLISGVSSLPAVDRAAAISKRIKKAASNPLIPADSVKIIMGENVLKIYAGEEFIMNVYGADAANEGISLSVMGELVQIKIRETFNLFRESRSRPVLLKKMIYAVGAIIFLAVALFVFLWLTKLINKALKNKLESSVENIESKSFKLIKSDQLWKIFNLIFRTLKFVLIVVIIIVFLNYVLELFPWTNDIAVSGLQLFLNPLITIGKGFIDYLPGLIFLFVIFIITRYLLKLVKLLFSGIERGAIVINNFYPDWAMATFRILRIFVIAFAVIIAYPYIPGSSSVAFKGVSVFAGVLLSLGSSSYIGNIVAGYSMTYRRAFKKGDRIEVGDHIGFVEDQKLLVTRLRSHKNEEIIIPNSILLNSHIINYSAKARENENGLILHTAVGIGYETPWRQVDAMLKLAAERTEGLLKEPKPFVLKQSLDDFAINYEINVYCMDVEGINGYYTVLHQNILDVFNENNVQIMTPAYRADPEQPKVVPKDQWNKSLANDRI